MSNGFQDQDNFEWKPKNVSPYRDGFFHHKLVMYADDELDHEEMLLIQDWLKTEPEYQAKSDFIRELRHELKKLNQIQFSEKVVRDIATTRSYLPFVVERLKVRQWPPLFRWAAEALIVVFVMVFVLIVIPWEESVKKWLIKSPQSIILAEFKKEPIPEEPTSAPQFQDELEKSTDLSALTSAPSVVATNGTKPAAKEVPIAPPGATQSSGPASPNPKATTAATAPPSKDSKPATAETGEEKNQTGSGFLLRGQVDVTNLESTWPRIRDKIEELGGRKAGEVELGWRKTATIRYFHFTIPEAQMATLQAFVAQYGKLQIGKEKHPRMMPDGINRVIINVTELKPSEPAQ